MTATTLNWNKKHDGKGYWATSPSGDELVIWGRSDDGEGFTLNVNGEVPFHGGRLTDAKRVAEEWVAAHEPKVDPVTAGAWSIDDAGNLWKDGEYIGRIHEEHQRGTDSRRFYAQGVDVGIYPHRRYFGIGSSSARSISVEEHAALSAKVAS